MPIFFSCPHCGAQTNVPDEYAGRSGPCASCGKPITIPHAAGATPPPRSGRGTGATIFAVIAGLLVLFFFCGGILVALMLPAVQAAREAARRSACTNNLRQIGLALHNYHDTYGELPPAYFVDENGTPTHSWRVMILPFLEASHVYSQYRFDEPWNSPHNMSLAPLMPPAYQCPSDPGAASGMTSYMAVVGNGAAFPGAASRNFEGFTDGMSNTIVVIEVAGSQRHWMEPSDLDLNTIPMAVNAQRDGTGISSFHPGGVNACFADGSVRFIPDTIALGDLRALLTADGGEPPPANY